MLVVIKGAGDIATGVACRLKNSGFNVVMTEIEIPTTVRRTVAFSRCVYEKNVRIEGIDGVLISSLDEIENLIKDNKIPILIDADGKYIEKIKPDILVDGIIAKKNLGTKINDAKIVIGLGPGFIAGKDCHLVIETNRGHNLGRCIYDGGAEADTGIPGDIFGYTSERILRANKSGKFKPVLKIGDFVKAKDVVAFVDNKKIRCEIDGLLRGLLQENVNVYEGMKVGDIDPRGDYNNCFTVSDKARSIAGGVLEGILHLKMKVNSNG